MLRLPHNLPSHRGGEIQRTEVTPPPGVQRTGVDPEVQNLKGWREGVGSFKETLLPRVRERGSWGGGGVVDGTSSSRGLERRGQVHGSGADASYREDIQTVCRFLTALFRKCSHAYH